MSRPPQYENGAYGADDATGVSGTYDAGGAHPGDGRGPVPPNVYHPQAAPPPAYDAYADPAAAHGWQNAYDRTAELPRITDGPYEQPPARTDGVWAGGEDGPGAGPGRRRHGRRAPGPWRSRRVTVAAAAVGAVSAAALIAGFSFSDAPADGTPGGTDRTGSTAADPVPPTTPAPSAPASSAGPAAEALTSDSDGPSRAASASPSASESPAASEQATTEPPVTATVTTGAPTSATAPAAPTAPTESAPGKGRPGHGQGGTKGPK
ncbi:hypothetical protein [Streptomyces bullii]